MWERSNAASISSNMYIGDGLHSSKARVNASANNDFYPPDSPDSVVFVFPNWILNCIPFDISFYIFSKQALELGSRILNILSMWWLTL